MFISKIVAGALLLNTGRQRPYTPPLEGVQSGIACLCALRLVSRFACLQAHKQPPAMRVCDKCL